MKFNLTGSSSLSSLQNCQFFGRSLHIAFIVGSEGHGGRHVLCRLAIEWGFLAVEMDLDMEESRLSYPIEKVIEVIVSYSLEVCAMFPFNTREPIQS